MPIEELEEKVRRMQATKGSQTTYLNINGTPNAAQGKDGDQAIRSTAQGKLKSVKIGSDWYDSVLLPSINKVGIASSKIGKLSITADEIDIKGELQSLTVAGRIIVNSNQGDVATTEAIKLNSHAALFVTAASETSTLAAGEEGQIIVLVLKTDGGNMATTVTNAGWKSSGTGTITFDTIGDACTLQYIDSKWYCIANNGVTFA